MITIMNLKYGKPSRPTDIKIDRFSVLGNPFFMKNESYRDEVCDDYEAHFHECMLYNNSLVKREMHRLLALYRQQGHLRLYCWCAPKRCHAETIKKWLEEEV